MMSDFCTRENTRRVMIGGVPLGGGARVTVQSMTNTDTRDAEATLSQIRALAAAGCDLVRVSVYDQACVKAMRALADGSPVPLVADVHFDGRLAIGALENGAAKVRINPGNLSSADMVRRVADCARAHHAPIRVGVNSGSVPRDVLARDGGVTARGMVDAAAAHVRLLEDAGFDDIVLSMKASDVPTTVAAYRLAAETWSYPLHLGVTEAGVYEDAIVKSAMGIGALLLAGIGDTIRVSLTGSPVPEAAAGRAILKAAGLLREGVTVVSCPTCGRTGIDVAGIAAEVRARLADVKAPLTVAVMGCVVNGPGEAREADVGIAGGRDGGALFERGKPPRKVTGDYAALLCEAARAMLKEREG